MITNVYQLVSPRTIAVKFEDTPLENRVLVRPRYMALCHADQRYYQGRRDPQVLRRKLPMALIHECMGEVLADPTGTFTAGDPVALIPNIPGEMAEGRYENYAPGSGFLSSGYDGFMRDVVSLPADRVVGCEGVEPRIAAITEFVSVAVHACDRLKSSVRTDGNRIAIIGDGSLAYVVACVVSCLLPEASITVIGHNYEKLSLFSFASRRYLTDELPEGERFDHFFECAGGEGSSDAINTAIAHANPQALVMLMGVSEHKVPVNTRDILEKGMTLIGCSRSGRPDFETAVSIMRQPNIQQRLNPIIHFAGEADSIAGIKEMFTIDAQTPFKTVFGWGL